MHELPSEAYVVADLIHEIYYVAQDTKVEVIRPLQGYPKAVFTLADGTAFESYFMELETIYRIIKMMRELSL